MNAQQLKNAILQEAITGRLVPQDPNDEPASVLLDRIRKEKAKLVKEGKLKKKDLEEKPITKEEIPFEIPESWEWCRLSTLYNFIDYRGSTPNKINSGIPLVTAKNVKKGYNDYSIKDYISLEEYNKRKTRGVSKRGDLLFTTEAPLGNVSIADLDVFSAGQRLITLQSFDNNIIKNKVIMFFMLADSFQKSLLEKKTGTTVAGIKASRLKDVLIPLPPLAEQHRIVAKIEELLPKVEEYGKAQEALDKLNAELPERLKKSILQEAITGRLVPQDPNDEPASVLLDRIRKEKVKLVKEGKLKKKDLIETPISNEEIPYIIPSSWSWVRLQDITIYISRGKSPVYSDIRKYPIVAQKCNQWTGFSLEKAKFADPSTVDRYTEERLLQDGDLLWNSTGLGTLGRMAIYNSCVNEYGWAVADSHVTVIRTMPEFCYYKYLFYYFASHQVQNVIEDKSDGSTKQKELAQETVRKYEVPLPPLAEQHRIVAKIEELLSKIDKLKTK